METDPTLPHPSLVVGQPDQSIPIGNFIVECVPDGEPRRTLEVAASIVFLPTQCVRLEYEGPPFSKNLFGSINGQLLYWLGENDPFLHAASQRQLILSQGETLKVIWEQQMLNLPGDRSTQLSQVISHVVSFPNFISKSSKFVATGDNSSIRCNSENLTWNGWQIRLSSHVRTSEYHRALSDDAAFAITHALSLAREDGGPFTQTEMERVLDDVYYFLSFSVGRRVGVGTEVSQDDNGHERFLTRGFRSGGPWHRTATHYWWDTVYGQADLNGAFDGFCQLQHHPIWGEHLTSILYWYFEANQLDRGKIATDTGIVIAQMALEKIAWVLIVLDRKSETEKAFKALSAWEKIRKAAIMLGLPIDIPADIYSVIKRGANTVKNIPHLITMMRNENVHPRPITIVEVDPYHVWNLAQWYTELMILRLCNYQGRANNRAALRKWRTAPEFVPWSPLAVTAMALPPVVPPLASAPTEEK